MEASYNPWITQWAVGEVIGRGGSGVVRAAVHRLDGRHAAIKRVGPAGLHEAATIARIEHPHVIDLYDFGEDEEGGWIAMERATGTVRVSDLAGMRRALDGLLSALAASHAHGVLHLDVKPGNLLVRADASVVLADFGLARGADGTRLLAGTPSYMAPEAFDGRPERLTPATDLYAVGCVAVALLTGAPPFPTQDWETAAQAHRLGAIPEFLPRFPVPAPLHAWIRTLLQTSPRARFQHAADARAALAELDDRVAVCVGSTSLSPSLTLTLQATRAGEPVPIEAYAPAATTPAAAPLPATWPARPARDPRNSGAGLLDLRSPPFTGRLAQREALWAALGQPGRLGIVGNEGSGRSRLGEAFAHAAAEAGCQVFHGTDVAALRRALWIPPDSVAVEDALALRLPPELLSVVKNGLDGDPLPAIRALSALRPTVVWAGDGVAEVPGALVVRVGAAASGDVQLPPFDPATCRSVLSRWVGLPSALVSSITRRCGGDIGLAVATVQHAVRQGLLVRGPGGLSGEGPLPLPPETLVRWARLEVSDPLLEAAVEGLEVTGTRIETLRAHDLWAPGDRWCSAAARAVVLEGRDLRAAHRVLAATIEGDHYAQIWKRGLHQLRGGDFEDGVENLYEAATEMNGAGKMIEVGEVLDEVEAALLAHDIPTTDPRWGWLWRYRAQLGPTFQGVAACEAHALKILELATDAPGWEHPVRMGLGNLAWLYNVLRLPRRCDDVLTRVESMTDGPRGSYTNSRGYQHLFEGNPRLAMANFEQAHSLSASNPYMEVISRACWLIAARYMNLRGLQEKRAVIRGDLHDRGYFSADADMMLEEGDWHRWWGSLHDSERCCREAIALSAQGEARAGPAFEVGLALTLLAQDRGAEARDRLAATAMTLDQGPAWEGLVGVHLLAARAACGEPFDTAAFRDAQACLEEAAYFDPDLVRSLQRLGEPAAAFHTAQSRVLRAGGAIL